MDYAIYGTYHTFTRYGMYVTGIKISKPVPKGSYYDIPGRRSKLDGIEAMGAIFYEDRTITVTAEKFENPYGFGETLAKFRSEIAGKRTPIELSNRPGWKWAGRSTIDGSNDGRKSKYEITSTVDPYQYRMTEQDGEWEWSPFNFNTGVIQPGMSNISVSGSKNVTISTTGESFISVSCTAAGMTAVIQGVTYNLVQNTTVCIANPVPAGSTTIKFTGTGSVTIGIREESL